MRWLFPVVAIVWASAALAAEPSSNLGAAQVDVSKYPQEVQDAYPVFQVRCSKCHALTRPLNARLRGSEWKNYIKKMIRNPGSGINEESGRRIYVFLKYHSEAREAEATRE